VNRPKIWLAAYCKGWAFDITAKALVEHLGDRFEFRIAYEDEVKRGVLEKWPAELVLDMWWNGTLHTRFRRAVVKQVTSHRWQLARWGGLSVAELVRRHVASTGGMVVPSRRLFALIDKGKVQPTPPVHLAPKGYDPRLFRDADCRRGPMTVGWAGKISPDKNVPLLVAAWPELRIADECLTQAEMPEFYNDLDVIAIASTAEGDPRPLIEGMACGCFVVTTDVGIVPELVEHGVSGLVVRPTREAFAQAFAWCQTNIDYVRDQGRINAQAMRSSRTWAHVAPTWGEIFDLHVKRRREMPDVDRRADRRAQRTIAKMTARHVRR
jgi:glycosyltransferase involved in cell wall biosynthesis